MKPLRDARMKSEEGLSLIELMIAVFILSISILALAGVATQSIARVRVARDQQSASDLVSAQMEAARGIDFAVLALDSSDASIPLSYDGAPIVKEAGGPLVHRETVAHGNRTYDIVRYVTAPMPDADQDPIKKVTIEVEWTDGDRSREVINSTIVAAADRGLPVPQFDIEPPHAVIAFENGEGYDPGSDDSSVAKCVTHTLQNLGLSDRYAVRVEKRQGANTVTAPAGGSLFSDSTADRWAARAWLHPEGVGVEYNPTSTYAMKDTEPETGDVWFEGSSVVATKASASLTVCYWSTDTGGADIANEEEYLVDVRSQFDESVVESLVHTVTVGEGTLRLHLHELTKNHTGNWSGGAHARKVQNNNYPPMFMDVNEPTNTHVHDMDTDRDGTSTPGLRIRHDVAASAAVWDYTVPATRALVDGRFRIRAAAPGVPDANTAKLTFSVQRVTADGATVLGTYVSGTVDLEVGGPDGATAEFQTVPVQWDFATGSFITGGEVLRLVIGCADDETATSVDCHVDFDNTTSGGNTADVGYLEITQ